MNALLRRIGMGALRVGLRVRKAVGRRQLARLFSSQSRRVLLVTGEYSQNGSSRYLDYICDIMQQHGYEIYALQYMPNRGQISRFWDRDLYLERSPDRRSGLRVGLPHRATGSVLSEYVRDMTSRLEFDVVVANYVFLSEALVDIDPTILKVIITHDVFTDRQTMRDSGSTPGTPLSAQRESIGLSRADLLVAITDDDRRYFVERLNQPHVITLPLIPHFQPLRSRVSSRKGSTLTVGFLGSAHWPNVNAIRAFIAASGESAGFSFLVGGKVCDSLRETELPVYVQLLGRQLSVKWFYRRCHLIVNPDMFQSGQKVKTVEALAYGMPVICTRIAASGLPSTSRYHQAESAEACVNLVEEIARQPERLELLRQDSIALYRSLSEHYLEGFGAELIGSVERNKAGRLMKPGPV